MIPPWNRIMRRVQGPSLETLQLSKLQKRGGSQENRVGTAREFGEKLPQSS